MFSHKGSCVYSLQDGSSHTCPSQRSQPDHTPPPPSHCEGVRVWRGVELVDWDGVRACDV